MSMSAALLRRAGHRYTGSRTRSSRSRRMACTADRFRRTSLICMNEGWSLAEGRSRRPDPHRRQPCRPLSFSLTQPAITHHQSSDRVRWALYRIVGACIPECMPLAERVAPACLSYARLHGLVNRRRAAAGSKCRHKEDGRSPRASPRAPTRQRQPGRGVERLAAMRPPV